MATNMISDKQPYPSKYVEVMGSKMHYIESGEGDPIVFLHGIPTSCYVWRNIIPYVANLGRCIAPDLIGFGQSDKPDIQYSISDHINYINHFIDALKLKRITFVMHGWGSIIGLAYAMHNEKNCKGLVFYEAFLKSFHHSDLSLPYQELLISLQQQKHNINASGVDLIDKLLLPAVIRELSNEEMKRYRQPFVDKGTAKPILQYLNELPLGDGKTKVDEIINRYSKQLIQSKLPKLLLYSLPGFVTPIETVMWAKENIPNLEIIDVGEELHLAQESSPAMMGEAISVWLQSIEINNEI